MGWKRSRSGKISGIAGRRCSVQRLGSERIRVELSVWDAAWHIAETTDRQSVVSG